MKKSADRATLSLREASKPVPLASVEACDHERFRSGIDEFDRVLGGGLVAGSVVLLGGAPGIGKSTLLLQVCLRLAGAIRPTGKCLYVTGEESARQVKLRASRLGEPSENLYVMAETHVTLIESAARELNPELMVIDSVQTLQLPELESAPGTVSQVRESAAYIGRLAKEMGIAVILVGHINKEGVLAGPKVLEHIVDVVLILEGDRHLVYRVLRGVKNRYGSTNEIGVFSMEADGLKEVADPSEAFLAERPSGVPGSVVVVSLEGARPLLVEVQALLASSGYATPRRTVTGVDPNRVALLLAVLEKQAGLTLGGYDAFVKVSGGLRLDEPGVDLGITLALASAFRARPVDPLVAVAGEVGLGGEVRGVARLDQRLAEAARLGFRRVIVPAGAARGAARTLHPGGEQVELVAVRTLAEAMAASMG